MLALSRKVNESIMIGDNIEVVVVDVRGDKVRLGIRAPDDVPIHRKEVYEQIVKERGHNESLAGHKHHTESPPPLEK